MTKTITRTHVDPPTITLELVDGGDLDPNRTYFYRAATAEYRYIMTCKWISGLSPVQGITTTSTKRSVRIVIAHASGQPEWTFLWRCADADPGVGNWCDPVLGAEVYSIYDNGLHMLAVGNPAKIDEWTDTGEINPVQRLGNTPNYGYVPAIESGQDLIEISGGTEADPITFADIYETAVAEGWPPEATIDVVTFPAPIRTANAGPYASGGYISKRKVWSIAAKMIRATGTTEFRSENEVIVLRSCTLEFTQATGTVFRVGDYDTERDYTSNGSDFVAFCHGMDASSLKVKSHALHEITWRVRVYDFSDSVPYGALFYLTAGESGEPWRMIDARIDGMLNNGIEVYGVSPGDGLWRRVRQFGGRYMACIQVQETFTIEDVRFVSDPNKSGMRIWLTVPGEIAARDLEFAGADGQSTGNILWLYVPVEGRSARSRVRLVDPIVFNGAWERIYWYWYPGGYSYDPTDESYVDVYHSLNITLTAPDGSPISGGTVTVRDNAGTVVATGTSGVDGMVPELEVKIRRMMADPSTGISHYQTPERTYEYGPHTITIEAPGYQRVEFATDIPPATVWTVPLLTPAYVDVRATAKVQSVVKVQSRVLDAVRVTAEVKI